MKQLSFFKILGQKYVWNYYEFCEAIANYILYQTISHIIYINQCVRLAHNLYVFKRELFAGSVRECRPPGDIYGFFHLAKC